MAKSESGALAEWRKNWKVVLSAGCGMSLVTMPTFGLGTFIAPLEAEFGWSRAQITSVLVIIAAFALCMGPVAGAAVDRFGPRRIGIAGVFLVCASVAMLSLTGSSIVSWWALWTIVALVAPFAGPSVWFSGVTSFFSAGRGLALGVTLCGSSIGTSLVPVLGHHLIENHGWRVAYLGIGAAFLFIVALPVLLFFTSAQDKVRTSLTTGAKSEAAVLTGPTAGQVFRSLKFARMALAAFGMTLCASSLIINLVPILVANGHATASAASMAGVLGLAAIAGRLLMGALLDRFNANVITASVITMASVFSLLLLAAPGIPWIAVLAIVALGFAVGAEIDAVAYLVTRHFGLRSFGAVFGMLGGCMAVAHAVGPVGASHLYDLSGSYRHALVAAIPVSLVTALLILTLGRYPDFSEPPQSRT
jgi:MFS family permease